MIILFRIGYHSEYGCTTRTYCYLKNKMRIFVRLFLFIFLNVGALAYAELGTMNPSSGAEYAYLMDAFGPMPAFLFSWISTLILKPSQVAIICLSFAKYAVEAFSDECDPPDSVVKIVAVLSICEFTSHTTYVRRKRILDFDTLFVRESYTLLHKFDYKLITIFRQR